MNKLLVIAGLAVIFSACSKEKTYTVEELYQDKALAEKVRNHCDTLSFQDRMNDTNCGRLETANGQHLDEMNGGKKHDPHKYE